MHPTARIRAIYHPHLSSARTERSREGQSPRDPSFVVVRALVGFAPLPGWPLAPIRGDHPARPGRHPAKPRNRRRQRYKKKPRASCKTSMITGHSVHPARHPTPRQARTGRENRTPVIKRSLRRRTARAETNLTRPPVRRPSALQDHRYNQTGRVVRPARRHDAARDKSHR